MIHSWMSGQFFRALAVRVVMSRTVGTNGSCRPFDLLLVVVDVSFDITRMDVLSRAVGIGLLNDVTVFASVTWGVKQDVTLAAAVAPLAILERGAVHRAAAVVPIRPRPVAPVRATPAVAMDAGVKRIASSTHWVTVRFCDYSRKGSNVARFMRTLLF